MNVKYIIKIIGIVLIIHFGFRILASISKDRAIEYIVNNKAPSVIKRSNVDGVENYSSTKYDGAQYSGNKSFTEENSSYFKLITLPKNITVSLPKNWYAISKNGRDLLETANESKLNLAGLQTPVSEFVFAANYYNDQGKVAAIFNIRYYPTIEIDQRDAEAFTAEDISALDNELHASFTKAMTTPIIQWIGTRKKDINGINAFITEYIRGQNQENMGNFHVTLVRVLNTSASFTITVSYSEKAEQLLKPICDNIILSIRKTQ